MTNKQDKLTTGWKIFIISFTLIFLGALVYAAYIDLFASDKKEFTRLSFMLICLVMGIVGIRPLIKRW